jgi:hypothetical protein
LCRQLRLLGEVQIPSAPLGRLCCDLLRSSELAALDGVLDFEEHVQACVLQVVLMHLNAVSLQGILRPELSLVFSAPAWLPMVVPQRYMRAFVGEGVELLIGAPRRAWMIPRFGKDQP